MLVLSRSLGESIVIGHEVKVVVLRVSRRQVKLGIYAPTGLKVNRGEVEERDKQAQGENAE